jgi:membrane associated rhomboid family serine protease
VLPIRDDIPASRYPAMTVALIAVNVLVFIHELKLGPKLEEFFFLYGVIPARYTHPGIAEFFSLREQVFAFFSSMFLHGGWLHLIGNLWTLWIFGDNVEDRLGRGRYLALYLGGGLAAALLHVFTNWTSAVPTVGASGAIAAVMGAYFRFYPHARIETIIPPFVLGPIFTLPAILFLGWWFLIQLLQGAMSLGSKGGVSGVAWWAHVGGFIFGFAICLMAARKPKRRFDGEW